MGAQTSLSPDRLCEQHERGARPLAAARLAFVKWTERCLVRGAGVRVERLACGRSWPGVAHWPRRRACPGGIR